ncbi:unnamed protein product, partial [Symbiodinium necroappetens]
ACADFLGPLFAKAFRGHFREGEMGLIHGDLIDASMVMLPKAGKPAHLLANLRPIGLMAPPSKSLAGVLRGRMMEWQLPRIKLRPQFAYVPHRGTFDALLRVHKHIADAVALFKSNRISRFGQHGGRKPLPFAGALSLSLDLSRAFDLTDRQLLFQALPNYDIPPAVVEVARRLHFGAKFIYHAGDHEASFTSTNGLKQGCKVAPCLWVWYTIALMDSLALQLSDAWVTEILTLFADDCWANWLLYSRADLNRALDELKVLLCTLESFRMQINYSKTAILLKFVGKQARQALHDITRMKNGVLHLSLDVNGVERLIPIKEEHERGIMPSNGPLLADMLFSRRTDWLQKLETRVLKSQITPPGQCVLNAMISARGKLEVSFACPHCSHQLSSEHALRIHIGSSPTGNTFAITSNQGPVDLRATPEPQAAPPTADDKPELQNQPLVARPFFLQSWHRWVVIRSSARSCTSWPLPPHSVSSRPQQETMTVDNSQGLNPEADIFRHCMVGQQDQDRVESGQKRPRPNPKPQLPPQRGYRRFPNRGQSEESELVQALARLALRQETQLAELRMDKGLVMFFRQDQISILPGLYAVSKEYNAMVAEGSSEITTPLRTLLLACLMRQFRERVVHMMSSMEGVSKLQAAGWLTADQVWTRQKWCRQTKKLVLDQKAEGMKHADLLSSIDFLLTNLRGDIIHQFHSTTKLKTLESEGAQIATFLMSISLRGPRAYEVHLHFLNLIGISALQLIGLSLKRESLQRSPAAKQLEALLYKR